MASGNTPTNGTPINGTPPINGTGFRQAETSSRPLISESIPRREIRNTTMRQVFAEEDSLTRTDEIDGTQIHPILTGYKVIIRSGTSKQYAAYVLVTELHNDRGIISHDNDNEDSAPPRVQGAVQHRVFIAEQRNGGNAQIAAVIDILTREVTRALESEGAIPRRNDPIFGPMSTEIRTRVKRAARAKEEKGHDKNGIRRL